MILMYFLPNVLVSHFEGVFEAALEIKVYVA